MRKARQLRMSGELKKTVYQQRVVMANVIAFLGFIIVWLDPYAGVTMLRLLIGAFIGGVGFLLRIWAASYQWPNIATPLPNARTGLITAGPYAYLRHPVYLGMLFLTCGAFFALGSWLAAIIVIIPMLIVNLWQASYEESFLVKQYGEQARSYHKHLPRFLPKIWRPYPIRNGNFSLAQGLKYDIGPLSAFLCFIVVMMYITLYQTPILPVILIVLMGSVFLSFFLTWLVRRIFKREFSL